MYQPSLGSKLRWEVGGRWEVHLMYQPSAGERELDSRLRMLVLHMGGVDRLLGIVSMRAAVARDLDLVGT